jgi:hypothetical protein
MLPYNTMLSAVNILPDNIFLEAWNMLSDSIVLSDNMILEYHRIVKNSI